MKWISILGDRNLALASIQRMEHTGAVRTYNVSDDRFCAEYPDGHIFFDYDTDLSDWQDEFEKLPFVIRHYFKKGWLRNITRDLNT